MKKSYGEALSSMNLTFRALTAEDADAYRALRLKGLQSEGHWFTANLEAEAAQTVTQWRAACAETTERVTFAAFQGDQLVGTTGVEAYSDHIAKWKSTFIEPSARGAGVAETLFEMCVDWCADHGFTEATFTIHPENLRSREIQEKNGAIYLREEPMRFADGTVANALWYRKPLL